MLAKTDHLRGGVKTAAACPCWLLLIVNVPVLRHIEGRGS